jgi:hypothetical protein
MTRVPAGRLNGVHAPEGTILGPTWTRELVVVTENDENGVMVGYATATDTDRPTDDPCSVSEFRKNEIAQEPIRARLQELFGRP